MKTKRVRWAFKTLVLSTTLSIVFSFISQSMFPKLSIFLSIFIIFFFIIISTVFDMIAVSVTSINLQNLRKHSQKDEYKTARRLVLNTEKVSSFCGDVVGDICGILSGAGGVSLVLNMKIIDLNLYFLVTCLVSSIIAGLTIFSKAIMKSYAVENAEKVVLHTAKVISFSPFKAIKNLKKRKNITKK